jgi:hypothetical protein
VTLEAAKRARDVGGDGRFLGDDQLLAQGLRSVQDVAKIAHDDKYKELPRQVFPRDRCRDRLVSARRVAPVSRYLRRGNFTDWGARGREGREGR